MSAESSRTAVEAAISMLLMGAAAVIVLLAGIAVVFLLPATLLIVVMGYSGIPGPAGGIGNWLFLAWFPLAFLAAIYNIVTGLETIGDPSFGGVAKLVGVSILIFFTFPPFLFPLP